MNFAVSIAMLGYTVGFGVFTVISYYLLKSLSFDGAMSIMSSFMIVHLLGALLYGRPTLTSEEQRLRSKLVRTSIPLRDMLPRLQSNIKSVKVEAMSI